MGIAREGIRCIPVLGPAVELVGGPKRAGAAIGALVMAGTLVGSGFSFDSHEKVTAGSGQVTNVYAMDKICYAGFDAKMKDVNANYGVTLSVFGHKITDKTGMGLNYKYDGTIANEVCHGGGNVNFYYPGTPEYKKYKKECAGKKICAVLKGKFEETTSELNPGQGYHMTHDGPLQAIMKNSINMADTVVSINGDGLDNQLRGLAFMSAQETSSTSCLNAALPLIKKAEGVNLAKDMTGWINGAAGFYHAKPQLNKNGSDVGIVDMATTQGATTQYSEKLAKIRKANHSLKIEPGSVGKCSVSPALERQLKKTGVKAPASAEAAKA